MSPVELERFQLERLKETVAYAYANVGLYHRKWQQAGGLADQTEIVIVSPCVLTGQVAPAKGCEVFGKRVHLTMFLFC